MTVQSKLQKKKIDSIKFFLKSRFF